MYNATGMYIYNANGIYTLAVYIAIGIYQGSVYLGFLFVFLLP
jgi:hypothetical protein